MKRSLGGQNKGTTTLILMVDEDEKLSIDTMEGDNLLDRFDLGHGPDKKVKHIAVSPSQDNHFVLTADDAGVMRVHDLKVITRMVKDDGDGNHAEGGKNATKIFTMWTNLTSSFSMPQGRGEVRELGPVVITERHSQIYFVTGDSLGGISVFSRNGTLRGRVRVTEDEGGIRGLLKAQSNSLLFYSSHHFGFFSSTQIDLQHPACGGWESPVFDVAPDPLGSYSRVVLALSDGDVLVFSTKKGKSKACDLTFKFPHVSPLPYKLALFRGHAVGLPSKLGGGEAQRQVELHFFNMAAMETGYGTAHSRSIALQVAFGVRTPTGFSIHTSQGGDKGKAILSMRFADEPGIALHDLSLKPPPVTKSAAGGGDGEGNDWLSWFPKIGVFGVALVGVVMWNVRKATAQKSGLSDFDEEAFKERLKTRREEKKAMGKDFAKATPGGGDDARGG